MTDNDELKRKIDKLENKVEELERKLKENAENDEKRHGEMKKIQRQHHKENKGTQHIQSFGIFLAPVIISLVTYFVKQKHDSKDVEIKRIIKLLEEQKQK
jgi:uncharacterized phage infection (PIP) family protein YhgE